MEQRFAVHARGDTEALNRATVRAARCASWLRAASRRGGQLVLVGVVLSLASVADAKPRRRDAKAAFDKGVLAYKKRNFEAASQALARSFELERDADTLFAWAQAQRQLANFGKAIELYDTLLNFDLPAKNRAAVETQLTECRELLAAQQPPPLAPPRAPPAEEPAPPVEPPPPPVPPPSSAAVAQPSPARPPVLTTSPRRSWYKDPVTLGLVGGGVVITAAGGGILLSAWSLDRDSKAAFASNHYDDAQRLADKAKSRESLGVITMAAGGVLVIGGAVWVATHPSSKESVVTGWLSSDGGGLAVAGAF